MGAVMTDGLMSDLQLAGYSVTSVDDLRRSGVPYADAVPLLLKWLPRAPTSNDKEGIVRALSVPWAKKEALVPLIAEFAVDPAPGTVQDELVRWAVGNALEVLWDDSEFEALSSLVLDPRFGRARQMVVLGLGKSRHPEVGQILLDLMEDPEVNGHAVISLAKTLRKFSTPQAREALTEKLTDERVWVRKAAQRALARKS